ncbi:hypothetical protein BHM03_00039393 [Ensete ventricosum]|nr:hypothetical protein BHM03_00039393 [Ensete ventricosum]
MACTTAFGKHKKQQQQHAESRIRATSGSTSEAPIPAMSDKFDMAAIHPPPKLADFYDFFSFSNLPPPILCNVPCSGFIRRREGGRSAGEGQEGDFFELEVCYYIKCLFLAYDSLMKAFVDHNKVLAPTLGSTDTRPLGVVIVKYCGYTATVNVSGHVKDSSSGKENINHFCSMRVFLPRSSTTEPSGGRQSSSDTNDMSSARSLVRRVLSDSLRKFQKLPDHMERSIRWELGASWLQHLQQKDNSATVEPKDNSKDGPTEPIIKGLGKQFEQLKIIKKKTENAGTISENEDLSSNDKVARKTADSEELKQSDLEEAEEIRKFLPEEAFHHLKDSETGLHKKG